MQKVRKILSILFTFIISFSFIFVGKVFAATNIIELKNISIVEETSQADGEISSYSSDDVSTNNTFHEVGSYIEYELTIVNKGSKPYSIKAITNNNQNNNIYYEYFNYKNKVLKPNKEAKIRIRENYTKEVSNVTDRQLNNSVKFFFTLVDENGVEVYSGGENPFTRDKIMFYMIIGALSLTAILIILLVIYIKQKKKQAEAKRQEMIRKMEEERLKKELEERFRMAEEAKARATAKTKTTSTKKSKKGKKSTAKKIIMLILLLLATIPINTKADSDIEAVITFNNRTLLYSKVNAVFQYNGIEKKKVIKYNSTLTEPKKPKKKGYTFLGWYIGNNKFDFTSSVTSDIVLKAKFRKDTYTITYNLDGGITSNPSTYNVSELPLTLNNPSKEGYTFTGWTGSNGDTPEKNLIIEEASDDLVYTANYKANSYDITYKKLTNAERSSLNNPSSYKITDSVTLNNPSQRNDKDGDPSQKFIGWKNDNNDVSKNVSFENSTGNKTFEAVWIDLDPTVYTITYYLNDGTVNGSNPLTFTKTTESFTLINPTKRGYEFAGWTGTGLSEPSTSVTIEEGTKSDLEYTANYTKINYTITYDLADGTLETANPDSYDVTSNQITLNNPSKVGYTFTGWTGTDLNTETINVTIPTNSIGNREYTANYTINTYNITYQLYDGVVSSPNPTTYKVTDTFTLNNPTKEGYEFTGWTWEGQDTPVLDLTITNTAKNLVLTANYVAANYNIHFDKNDSAATGNMSDEQMTVGVSKKLTKNAFTKTGYTFEKWTTNSDGTGTVYEDEESVTNLALTGTVTLYAKWKKVKTATFITGSELRSKMISLAGNISNIKKFKYSNPLLPENKDSNNIVSVSNQSDEPIYMWWDSNTNTIYYGSDADVIYLNKTCSYMFNEMQNIEEIDTNFDTSKCTNMQQMFYMNKKLATIELSHFDTSNVKNMFSMFGHNYTAHSYDINNWDVSNVENFQTMFVESSGITSLDLSNWHTDSATNMVKMFANVNQATSIKIDNFNTSKVTNMEKMFSDTKKLKTLDLSNFDTRRTTSMQQFFQNTYELESVTLGPLFTIENTKNVTKMFQNTGLTTVDISMFNTAKVNTFNNMFDGATNLTTIYVGTGFVTTGQTSNPTMFDEATSLVGGNGTTYSDKTKTYARIDDPDNGNPGYFTLKQ